MEGGNEMRKNWCTIGLAASLLLSSAPVFPTIVQAAESFTLEAEDYIRYSGNLKVLTNNSNASGGKYVGDFDNLDCLTYQIEVEKAGNYQILLTVGTIQSQGKVLVNSGGSISKETAVPNTGSWNTYQDIETSLWLEPGIQELTVSNMGQTWNLDKLTISYLNSDKIEEEWESYDCVYLDNRWKSQRIVEQDGEIRYANLGETAYSSPQAQWKLTPDQDGWYTIQNVSSKGYLVMEEGSQAVSCAADASSLDTGKWSIGTVGDYLVIFNKHNRLCGLNLEYQADYPNQVLATEDTLIKWYSAQWQFHVPASYHEYSIDGTQIQGTTGTAVSTDGRSITATQQGSPRTWTLSEDLGTSPRFTAEQMPIMEAVYNLSLEETLLNIHQGAYGDVFWTGTNWSKVWTRDTAMSVQYSLAWIFPEETKNSILEKVIGGTENPRIWEENTGTGGSYPSSIDRIIMEIAGWELYLATGDKDFLEQIYEISSNTLEQDYHVAYDEASGLFKGETGGLDHRSKTYPDWMDENEQDSISNIAQSKAANANIIFAQALNIMANSARILGKEEDEISEWESKYQDLKQAINERLWLNDRGMYASWEYPEYMGSPVADKVDVIANGYALMFDIADEQQKQEIMENYPLVVYGADTVWPQKNGRQASTIYHNRGIWPGWEAALMIGAKENGNLQLTDEIFKSCVRGAGMSLTNKEVIHFETGEGLHSDRQLWSIAGTLSGYYRVLFGMSYSQEGVSFAPYAPDWMKGPYSLSNYPYRNAVLNLTVNGNGDTLSSITVNGEEKPLDYVLSADAQGAYDIVMNVTDSGRRSKVHLEEDSWAVCPDLPVLEERGDGALTWDENPEYTYKLWNGETYIPVSGGSYFPSRDSYGVYSLVAVDKNGISSEMSKPVILSPDHTKRVYEAEDGEYNPDNFEATASGYTGTGYVVDFLDKKTDLKLTVEASETGNYQIGMIYNNYGDATSGQDCGIRSVYVDGVDAGTLVFPVVKYDFQQSTHLFLTLEKGTHTIEIRYNADDWYDTNMTTSRGSRKNSVCYDSLTLQFLGAGDTLHETIQANLKRLIAQIEELDSTAYTAESWVKVSEALRTAREAAADPLASRKDLDLAMNTLIKAFGGLEYGSQRLHLKTALDAAKDILTLAGNYEEEARALKAAVQAGETVLADPDASQSDIDQAAYAILDELAKLAKKADLASLESLIQSCIALLEGNYTENSLSVLDEAVTEARKVADNPNRVETEIQDAYLRLVSAVMQLQRKGNKAALEAIIAKASSILNAENAYVASTIRGLDTCVLQAETVYRDENATLEDVTEAVEALTRKVASARYKGDVDGNGAVGTSDSAALLQYAAESRSLDQTALESADVNGDGTVDTKDAVLILQYASEKRTEF